MATKPKVGQITATKPRFEYVDVDRSQLTGARFYDDTPASSETTAPERTWGQALGDTAVQLAEGVNTTLGAVPSIVAPEGAMAGFFRGNAEHWRDKQSDVLKERIAGTDQRIQEAGKDGVMSQIGTAVSEYWNDPAQAARLVATNLPSMAATLGTGAAAGIAAKGVAAARGMDAAGKAALAAKYGTTTAAATNAALNAGGARGEAFEDLQQTALAQGMSPEQAEQAGVSGSILPGVVGGVAGAISGKMGLEKALLGQATTGAATRKAAGAFGAELAGEQIEELAPKVATNYQVGQVDPERGLTDDLGRTMVETAIGSGPGAVAAGGAAVMRTPAQEAADAIRATEKLPESGALTKAMNAGVEAKAQAVEAGAPLVDEQATAEPTPEPVDDPVRDQILALPDGARQDALRAYAVVNRTDVAKGVQQYNRKLLDRLLAENAPPPVLGESLTDTDMGAMLGGGGMMGNADPLMGALGMNREAQANSITNVARAAQNRPPMPASDAVRMLDEARNQGVDLVAAEHPAGGFVLVPPQWVTPEVAAQGEQRLNETIARMQQADAAPVERAPRSSTAPVDLSLPADPVQNYVGNLRTVNTPAARAYVQDFDAGRITPADVQQRMQAEQGLAPEQRIARAAAEAPATADPAADRLRSAAAQAATVTPTDILNPSGLPFKTKMAADLAAKKSPGAAVLPVVDGGFLVRPKESVSVQDVPQAPEVPQAAPAISQPGQAPQAVGTQPAGPAAGVPAAGAGAVEAAGVEDATPDTPTIVEVQDNYGRTHRVRQSDLYSNADRIPTVRKNGEVVAGEEIPRSIVKGAPSVAEPPPIDPLGWNAKKLASTYDMAQMQDLYQYVLRNYSNPVVGGGPVENGKATTERFNAEGREIHKALQQAQTAIYERSKAQRAQDGQTAAPMQSGENQPAAQAAQAAGAQAQTQGAAWDGLDPQQRTAVLSKAGWITNKGGLNVIGKRLLNTSWEQITGGTREIIARNIENEQGVAATAGVQEPPSRTPEATALRLGRDNTPLSEGGKPFKTRKAAGDAKKLQPMMRVVSVKGGYALAEKTPAQLAAEAKAARRLAQPRTGTAGAPLAAHEFIAAEGGLNAIAASDLGIDDNPRIGNRRLFAGRGRGLSMEQATQKLIQDGYLSEGASINDALALIKTSLTRPQYNADGIERIAEAEVQAQFEDYLAAQEEAGSEVNPWDDTPVTATDDFSDDMLEASGYDAATDAIKAEVRALLEMANAQGIDTESIMLDAHERTSNATEQDYYEAAKTALEAAITGSNRDSSTPAGSESQGQGQERDAANQELNQTETLTSQAQTATESVAPGTLELAAQTPAEAAALQGAQEQAAKAEAARQRAADAAAAKEEDRKRIAQASVRAADRFELGQDPLDSLTGQGSMFDDAPVQQAPTDDATRAVVGDIFGGITEQEAQQEERRIDGLREKLRDIEDKIVNAAGMARGFIEDAMNSRKVPKPIKDQRNALRAQIRDGVARLKNAKQSAQQAPTATETVAQPITRADVTAAQQQAATLIAERIDAMTAQEVQAIARRFLPAMGVAVPAGKARIKAAVTDFTKVNPMAAADEFGVTLPADVRRALDAEMQGKVADAQPAVTYINGDRAEYTGNTETISGGLFYEVRFTEGAKNGKTAVTQRAPDGENPGQRVSVEPTGIVTPQLSGNPAQFIKIAADSIKALRKVDVDRVLTETPDAFRQEVSAYIRDQRKDLADEVDDVMADIQPKAAAPAFVEPAAAKPAPVAKPAAPSATIEDAGEKIGGARKDRWKERGLNLDDLDAMTEAEGAELATKANVWKPDYDALAEASEPVTAAMVKTIYDQLAAKPKKNTPEGRRQYVQMMRIVRDVLTEANGPDAVRNAYLEIRKRAGLNTMDPKAKEVARGLLFSVYKGRSDPFVLGGADLMKAKKMVEDGFPAKAAPWKSRLTVGRREGGNGVTERGIEMYMELSADVGTPLSREQIEAGFFRVVDKQNKTVAFAPTKEDAEAAAETVYERDLKGKKDSKPEPVRPNLDELKRENLPRRIDRDVTADDFVKDLGFRGIEFGLWSAQDERQRILNMAYDGLMDLAEIMGVPPKAMSLNGTLGMAFGARGGGRFAAHYEPGKLVINMTKIRGGGSMAHEWAHALDHYFGELDKADAYTTQARGASGWYAEDQYVGVPRKRMERVGNEWKSVEKMRLDNLRPEMAAAFDEVMRALFSKQITKAEMVRSHELDLERTEALARNETQADLKAMYQNMAQNKRQALNELRGDPEGTMYAGRGRSDYANQAQALSGKSTDGYWVRPTEMFARAFESWVFDRVTAMGAKSDYLVHGVEEDRFAGGAYKGNPYPTGEERARINAAFDKLAGTIQTKQTDKGVAMFSRAPATKAAYEARIDALFAGEKAAGPNSGARVLDRSDVLGLLGFGDGPVNLAEGKVIKGQENHPRMTAEQWKKVPEWLDNPAAVFDSDTVPGALVLIAPETINGATVRMTVEPRKGGGADVHILSNAYDAPGFTPFARWFREGLGRLVDQKKFPAVLGDSGLQLSSSTWQNKPGMRNILTEKHLDGYRRKSTPAAFMGQPMPPADSNARNAATQLLVGGLKAKWTRAPEIIVARNMQDAQIPQEVRDYDALLKSQGATGEPRGFIYQGKVYLLSDQLKGPQQIAEVLFHEVLGHYGLRGAFGDGLTPILKQLGALRRKDVVAKAREYGLFNKDALGWLDKAAASDRQIWAAMSNKQRLDAAEEVLAEMAQTKPELGYVKRAIAAIRNWLRANVPGFKSLKLTDADIVQKYLLPARAYVTRSNETAQQAIDRAMGDAGFSRAPAGDQTQTMTEEQARQNGFTLKAFRGISKSSPFNDSGTTWLTTSRDVAEAYAEEVMGYDDPGVLEVMVKPDGLPRHDASRLTDEQREAFGADEFGNPQSMGIYDRSDDHPLGGSKGNVTVIHAPRESVVVLGSNAPLGDQTQTEAFKRWFGDSKAVDADGKPLVVYHGTNADISAFDASKLGTASGADSAKKGFFFASNPAVASSYADTFNEYRDTKLGRVLAKLTGGLFEPFSEALLRTVGRSAIVSGGNVMPVYLAIKNPKIVDFRGSSYREKTYAQIISEAKSEGHDGLILRNTFDEGYVDGGDQITDVYVAFEPTQIKSAIGNNGNFDPTNPDIRFSRTTEAAKAVGDAIKSVTVTNIKQRAGFKATDYLGLGLQALGRRQIVDIYGDMLPLAEYNRLVTQMEADKNEGGAEADKLVTRWAKLDDEAKLADLMHDATLAQIDPDKPYADGDDKGKFLMLERKFKLLSDEAKAVYRDTRDAYKAHHEKVRSAIKERIERSELKGARKAELLQQMDSEFFAAVKGVYFPLARFGQYVVTVKGPDGKVESVSRAETMAEADALRTNLLSAFPREKGFTVGRVMLSKEFVASRDAVGRGFMTELYQVLDKQDMDAAQRAELEDTLGQLYLSSLPDLSWAKHGIHRKGTPGFSQDARRAYAQNMFHGARYLAKLRYSDLMQDELTAMQKHVDDWREVEDFDQTSAQRVVDEMNKRHESLMNPKSNPLSTALTSFGFIFHLGLSPASAMVNLSQTALVAYPIMGAKWGFGKASAALLKASADAAKGKNDITASLNEDELAAYNEAVRAGTIDVTMAHDLAGIAQGEDAGVMWKIRPVMRWASFLFHHAERFNRQVTFVAAYRLAREAGADHKAAFEQATKATYDGHFDYGAANRPRIMQGNVAKVLLLFKQYGQNMVYTLARNAQQAIKGESPEARAQARKALGGLLATHAMAAGVLGLPMVTTLLAAASMIGGDDDEPWDAKVALQNMLADTLGQKPAEVLAHGLSRLTPWDISGRVGLDKLIFPDVQEGLEGQRLWESAATQALGPVGGIFGGLLKGADLMSDGHYKLGLEAMLPAVLRQGVKSIRYATEGAQDKGGVVIKDEVSLAGVAGQFLGFSPSEVRLAQEGKSAIYQHDKALTGRREELLGKAARATRLKDAEARAEAMKEIERFNQKNPKLRITPLNVAQSVRNSQRRIDQAEGGIYLPKNRRAAMEAGRFAVEEVE